MRNNCSQITLAKCRITDNRSQMPDSRRKAQLRHRARYKPTRMEKRRLLLHRGRQRKLALQQMQRERPPRQHHRHRVLRQQKWQERQFRRRPAHTRNSLRRHSTAMRQNKPFCKRSVVVGSVS